MEKITQPTTHTIFTISTILLSLHLGPTDACCTTTGTLPPAGLLITCTQCTPIPTLHLLFYSHIPPPAILLHSSLHYYTTTYLRSCTTCSSSYCCFLRWISSSCTILLLFSLRSFLFPFLPTTCAHHHNRSLTYSPTTDSLFLYLGLTPCLYSCWTDRKFYVLLPSACRFDFLRHFLVHYFTHHTACSCYTHTPAPTAPPINHHATLTLG